MLFEFSKQVAILKFQSDLVWRQPLRRQCRWGGAEPSQARAVPLSLRRSVYLCLAYYCHIKIRTLHFVSNFQFSLYRMLARARRLACRHTSLCTCLRRALDLLHI